MDDKHKRKRAQKRGIYSEFLAACALRLKGYKIVARNYKTKLGEIDLIARKGDLIAIVEVKARPNLQQAIDAVGYHSVHRIQDAADLWLGKQDDASLLSLRFDIISVQPWRWPIHLEDAF